MISGLEVIISQCTHLNSYYNTVRTQYNFEILASNPLEIHNGVILTLLYTNDIKLSIF